MKFIVSGLAVILALLQLAAARSLPSKQMARLENNPGNINTVSEVQGAQLQTELANLSIPSYLKDLYINLTHPSGVAHSSLYSEEFKVNTIQSYKNQAKSKLSFHYSAN